MTLIPIPANVSVLNCGAGDMVFSFDSKDPLEVARAERVVKDMLKRGYMLFAKVDGEFVRVKRFDAKTCEYVIADGPTAPPIPLDEETKPGTKPPTPSKRGRGNGRRVSAKTTSVTGVAPSAGG